MSESSTPIPALDVLCQAPIGVLVIDRRQRVAWINPTLEGWLGTSADALVGRDFNDMPRADLGALFSEQDEVTLTPPGAPARRLRCVRTTLAAESPLRVHYYSDLGELTTLRDECAALAIQLRAEEMVDAVTRLPTLRALTLALEPQLARCRRYGTPLTLMVLAFAEDGVTVHETLLRAVGQMLRDQLRWADMIGRGEAHEFIMALPETRLDDAVRLTQKIRERILRLPLRAMHGPRARFGVAEWSRADDGANLLARARQALQPLPEIDFAAG